MKRNFCFLVAVLVILSVVAAAQQPRMTNAKIETRSAAGGLEKEFNSLVASISSPAWIGYAAPLHNPRSSMCCWSNNCPGCTLEGRTQWSGNVPSDQPVKLEGSTNMLMLYRVENHVVDKIRAFTEDCPLDAGGLTFHWLTDVRAADSVRLLTPFAKKWPAAGDRDRTANAAVSAIAMHKDSAADSALEQFTASDQPEGLRSQAAFWLGVERGAKGYDVLKRMLVNDPSDKVRERVVFALSQSKEPGAIDTVIGAAKNDKTAHVRSQALFWLAQKAGKKVAGEIAAAIENDPDNEVKKRAVFALSQLPKDEGVPLLIQVARNNKNPVARKQAIFWLGQSKDPRALSFFEEVLTR